MLTICGGVATDVQDCWEIASPIGAQLADVAAKWNWTCIYLGYGEEQQAAARGGLQLQAAEPPEPL